MTSRLWLITHYPENEFDSKIYENLEHWPRLRAIAGQEEICPTTGRHHWQIMARTHDAIRGNGLIKYLNLRGNAEKFIKPKGEKRETYWYVHKDETAVPGTRFNYGDWSDKQGERTDLKEIVNDLSGGKVKLDDLILDKPIIYHQYGRTLEKVETIRMKRNKRVGMTKGIWLWGGTGTGKSHTAYNEYGKDGYYTWVKGSKFQCGYTQQDCIIINEFRGELKFSELLDMCDKWEYMVERKGKDAIPLTSSKIVITSAVSPQSLFVSACSETDRFDQFLRRFTIIEMTKRFVSEVV